MATDKILVRTTKFSEGARNLVSALGKHGARMRPTTDVSKFRHIINWGSSRPVEVTGRLYNNPAAVKVASNKLLTFNELALAEVRVPQYSETVPSNPTGMWFARKLLRSSQGKGIEVVRQGDPFPSARLYVKYVPKIVEYRIHVIAGEVVLVQQKRKVNGVELTANEKLIRNYDNGWIFTINDVVLNPNAEELAVRAVAALNLDFGAVDIVVGRNDGLPYVLEVNTAPGLSSPTLIEAYATSIKEMCGVQ